MITDSEIERKLKLMSDGIDAHLRNVMYGLPQISTLNLTQEMALQDPAATSLASYEIKVTADKPVQGFSINEANDTATAPFAPNRPSRHVSNFKFGRKSHAELVGVHPTLVKVATIALVRSTQDFMIFDGLRTKEEQAENVKKGVSQTLHSKHLKQSDGYSHAVDAVPIDSHGLPSWDWELIYPIVLAFDEAATELGVADKIVWGGAWDRRLSDFNNDAGAYEIACADYVNRRRKAGQSKVFIDGPHYQWMG